MNLIQILSKLKHPSEKNWVLPDPPIWLILELP